MKSKRPLRSVLGKMISESSRFRVARLLLLLAGVVVWGEAFATPQVFRVDGSIFDSLGAPFTGNKDIQIKAYDAASGGSLLWTSSTYNTSVSSGRFTINLDASSGSPSLVDRIGARTSSQAIYFQVEVDSDAADGSMTTPIAVAPRIRAKGTTFALNATAADSLKGVTVTSLEINYLSGATSNIQTQLNSKLALAGGTMSGMLTLSSAPAGDSDAATKAYVDAAGGSSNPNDFQNVQSFFTAGVSTWVVPAGVTRIKVELCGGGGGGGYPSAYFHGGGGGGGAQTWAYLSGVTAGTTYSIAIGGGGAAASSAGAGTAGSNSTFGVQGGSTLLTAGGGAGGASNWTGGAGGSPSCSTNCHGAAGQAGYINSSAPVGGNSACGGSGGYYGNLNGYQSVGGTPGSAPGGGGGPAMCNGAYGCQPGGVGGVGRATIWW